MDGTQDGRNSRMGRAQRCHDGEKRCLPRWIDPGAVANGNSWQKQPKWWLGGAPGPHVDAAFRDSIGAACGQRSLTLRQILTCGAMLMWRAWHERAFDWRRVVLVRCPSPHKLCMGCISVSTGRGRDRTPVSVGDAVAQSVGRTTLCSDMNTLGKAVPYEGPEVRRMSCAALRFGLPDAFARCQTVFARGVPVSRSHV